MPGTLKNADSAARQSRLSAFEASLAKLPDGYCEGQFDGRRWSATLKRSADGKRIWLFGEELGGKDIVSFNFYVLETAEPVLKPCEMSSDKVIDFVLGFEPDSALMDTPIIVVKE